LITFDDGNLDNYTNAFPIMQRYGFSGVMYIVGNYIGAPRYMNVDQIREMTGAGWEVGSHSMTHPDLTKIDPQLLNYEILASRKYLGMELGLPILSFSYPFGTSHCGINDKVFDAGILRG
jgi:peptidoglycan/xylan/chitin deacetylase (PgdA/CDA1 family)